MIFYRILYVYTLFLFFFVIFIFWLFFFFFQAEDGIRDAQESRGLGDVYKRQSGYLVPSTLGSGFMAQVDPTGRVPLETYLALNQSCFPPFPPHLRLDMPSNGRGVRWKHSSVRASRALISESALLILSLIHI
eukprot:TRINITY_DN43789_c0_g1_i1.p1 TRINITY_DN43789_c0_g1~~TRINITY_DN43789_c0_g1_i1.p1  ORF type:complete len:133 (+),score=20.95 TRINITY_DN43789_c0_g1_i1:27-425(+)